MELFLYISIFSIIVFILILLYFTIYMIYIFYKKYQIQKNEDAVKKNCKLTRWGCCKDRLTPRLDPNGTNCRGF